MDKDHHKKLREVSEELAASFVKSYKYSLEDATSFFYDNIVKNEAITKIITDSASEKQLSKNAAFKEFVKKNKKELYYRLRKYKGNDESRNALLQALDDAKQDPSEEKRIELLKMLAQFHVSSQERYSENEIFYQHLAAVIEKTSTLVDVGCGVQPLFFPHEQFQQIIKYVALDKDKESIALIEQFKNVFAEQYSWLQPMIWNIADGWERVSVASGLDNFDAALILKVVPVVKRVDVALLDELAKVPAAVSIISGVKESMVKKHEIGHKERRAINQFIERAGKRAIGEFDLENEFFIIVS